MVLARDLSAGVADIDDSLAPLNVSPHVERGRSGPRAHLAALNCNRKTLRFQTSFFVRARFKTEGAQVFGQLHGPLENVLGAVTRTR